MGESEDTDLDTTSGERRRQSRSERSVTMRDVAERAGVSIMTVSRVLNDDPGVANRTAASVRKAASEIGYRKNELARNLRLGERSKMIAVVIGDIANPFYGVMTQAIERIARASGYAVVVLSTNEDPDIERAGILDLLSRRVDGLILVSCDHDHSYLRQDVNAGLALVFVDRPPHGLAADAVLANDRVAARAATLDLLERGHEKIAFVGDYDHVHTAAERRAGFDEAVDQAAVAHSLTRLGVHTRSDARRIVAEWLGSGRPPTAIIAGNNLIAAGASEAIRASDQHVELVGFDLLPESETDLKVGRAVEDYGSAAATLLFEQITGARRDPVTEILELTLNGIDATPAIR